MPAGCTKPVFPAGAHPAAKYLQTSITVTRVPHVRAAAPFGLPRRPECRERHRLAHSCSQPGEDGSGAGVGREVAVAEAAEVLGAGPLQ